MQLTVGAGQQTVNIQIKNTGDAPTEGKVTVSITIPGDLGLTISSKPAGCSDGTTSTSCDIDSLAIGATKNLPIGISPPAQSSIPAGGSKSGGGQAIITAGGSDTKGFNVTLKAAAAAPTTQAAPTTVTEVSGTITDSATGKAVGGATVVLEDGAGKRRQLQTPTNGTFKFTGTDANPIAPGTLTITAGASGFDNETKQITGTAGKANTQLKIGLPVLADTQSAAPLPTANDPAIIDNQSANGVVPQNTQTNNASNDSGGGVSWILIALGVLLVGFGIVAIVLLLRRRGDDDDDDENDEPAPRRGAPGGVRPGGYGQGPDPTMVGAMGPAATMVNRGGSNDATAIVRPGRGVFDDVPPDPYGAPPPGQGGYPSAGGYDDRAGFASGGYNGGGANGYGAQGRPAPGPAVDPYAPDYNGGGAGGGYPDATQRYDAGNNNGYNNNPATGGNSYGGGQGGGYGGGANGYDGQGNQGYGDGPSAGGGYGGGQRGGGYEGPPASVGGFGGDRGGYDGPSAGGNNYGGGGYDDRGAQGGYDDRGGYGQGQGQGGGQGYGADRGGYGPSAGGQGAQGGYDDRGGYGPGAGGGQGGYDDRGGYGQGNQGYGDGPSAGGGYNPAGGDRGGYGPNGGGDRGGYDGQGNQSYDGQGNQGYGDGPYAGRGGYEPASGYERDGYERVPEPPRAGNGYGPGGGPAGNYDDRGGYGPNGGGDYDDARSQGRGSGGNRRPLDWLDD
ncbi:carboxypeptidase-like regulatory domain-containing protein [Dactylosporangium sp. CS-033363]|uniref:carboxypeptidase-like regulatory domain-containing protein n=1 Tax=Dactylosporangium sp. CS-033363 TaxID=3239935 RepID=UPI003D8FDE4F